MKTTAIVLAGGRGKRMNSAIPKQFLTIQDKPVLYYSLRAFETSFIDSIILVASEDDREYCQREIVEKYEGLCDFFEEDGYFCASVFM